MDTGGSISVKLGNTKSLSEINFYYKNTQTTIEILKLSKINLQNGDLFVCSFIYLSFFVVSFDL